MVPAVSAGKETSVTQLHLAVALDGAGWHPAAWRTPQARPRDLLTAGYWSGLLAEAERGLLDFATIDDSLTIQSADPFAPDERTDQVRDGSTPWGSRPASHP